MVINTNLEVEYEKLHAKIDDQTRPYNEKIVGNNLVIRIFDVSFPEHLYKWHFDEEDRIIMPLNETDWKFQFDNELPQWIEDSIHIEKNRYHRLIRGTKNLELLIIKK